MKSAIISTIHNLKYSEQGDIYMCLAWLCSYEKYRNFFKQKKAEGHFVILDNGENESKQMTGRELVDLAIEVATEVIAPDTFRNIEDTNRKTFEFISTYGKELRDNNIKIQAVVQGHTLFEALHHFRFFEYCSGVDTIGLGFNNYDTQEYDENRTQSGMLSRLFLTQMIEHSTKPVHLLGLYNPIELKYQKKYPWIRSNDSSAPVLCGMHLIEFNIDEGVMRKPAQFLDFRAYIEGEGIHDLIERNIKILKEWRE